MTNHKVSELKGPLLRRAVAMAEGHQLKREESGELAVWFKPGSGLGPCASLSEYGYCPDINWQQGGPIIERERISILSARLGYGAWGAAFRAGCEYHVTDDLTYEDAREQEGPTPLIAAMRAYVASKFGDTIELEA